MFEPDAGGHHGARHAEISIAHGRRLGSARRRRLDRRSAATRTGSGAAAVGRQLPRPQGPAARPQPQHGLRGGPLPEHRGVLGPAHRDDHDPGRHLHPRLRVLRGQDRPADLVRRRRAAPRRRGGRARCGLEHVVVTSVARDDLPDGGARDLRRDDPPDARALARAWASRSSSPTSTAPTTALRTVMDARPDILNHNLETVQRLQKPVRKRARWDRSAVRPATGPRRWPARSATPVHTKSSPDGRPRRDARRADRGVRGAARGRRRHPHDRPVPAARRCSTCRSSATTTPTSSPR